MEVTKINGYDIKDKKAIRVYDNILNMQSDTTLKEGMHVKTKGYYTPNDEGHGEYIIVNDSTLVSDNGSIHTLINGLKAMLLIDNNTINVKQFGAKGDDNTDDTLAIQTALNIENTDVFIPNGTYLVSTLIINRTIKLYGNSNKLTVIKSIPNNTYDSVIQVVNSGLNYTEISNIYVNGNRTNNTHKINGIQLWCNDQSTDRYTYLHDIVIRFCTGNGLYLGTDSGSTNMKEQRFYNIEVGNNDENGIHVKNATDGYFSQLTSHRNLKNGFLIEGGNHKTINCKAFWNGEGISGELEEIKRLPSTAFTETSDTVYNSDKTYYIRTGTNTQNSWYEFSEFTGDTFSEGTTYYELTTQYQKRYHGFNLQGARNIITGCESQENFGDGFYINTNNLNIVSVLSDTNGLLIDSNNNMISYNSVNKSQLYCGLYINAGRAINIIGDFVNSRVSSIGKYQLAPIYIRSCNNVSFKVTSDENVNEFVMFQKCNMSTSNGTCNNQDTIYDYDMSSITFVSNTLSLYNNEDYKSYIRKVGSTVYFKLTINDSTGNILTDTSSRTLFYLNSVFRPKENIFFLGYLTNNEGNTIVGVCNVFIGKSGTFAIRTATLPGSNTKGVHVVGSYVIKER